MLNNNFSCTKLSLLFLLQKDSYYIHDDTDTFLFVLQKDFGICLGPFSAFFIFLLWKDFNIFHMPLFEAFLCVYDNIYLPFLYIEKK